jgi:hypothetical protein
MADERSKTVKRVVLLVIPLFLLVGLGIAVVAQTHDGDGGLPFDCQARLDEYLADQFWPGTMAVQSVARAHKPWRFTDQMTSRAFGDSVHFQTIQYSDTLSALRFPPDEVWCVLLKRKGITVEEAPPSMVLFAALHMDMYNADWIVHEAADKPSSPEFSRVLSTIGCDLTLD